MTTRREFIQAGLVIGAAAAPMVSAMSMPITAPVLAYTRVAFDSRSEFSLMFAAEARRLGAQVHDIDGDISGLYRDHLLDRWRVSPYPVAGMTRYSSMFVLKMMAEGAGLRLIYQARHQNTPNGENRHIQFGPTEVLEKSGGFSDESLQWPRKAARIVMAWPADAVSRVAGASNILQSDMSLVSQETLVSWILAPAQGAKPTAILGA